MKRQTLKSLSSPPPPPPPRRNQKDEEEGFLLCLTSAECFHCTLLRGFSGDLSPRVENRDSKKFGWDDMSFRQIMESCNVSIVDIHFFDLRASAIKESSLFSLVKEEDTLGRRCTSPTTTVVREKINSPNIPPVHAFYYYARKYPTWFYMTKREWDTACNNNRWQRGRGDGIDVIGQMIAVPCDDNHTTVEMISYSSSSSRGRSEGKGDVKTFHLRKVENNDAVVEEMTSLSINAFCGKVKDARKKAISLSL